MVSVADRCWAAFAHGIAEIWRSLDECEGPPNFKELADNTGFGLNVNGSVCLNNICMCVL